MPFASKNWVRWQCSRCAWHQPSFRMDSDVIYVPRPSECPQCGAEVVLKTVKTSPEMKRLRAWLKTGK